MASDLDDIFEALKDTFQEYMPNEVSQLIVDKIKLYEGKKMIVELDNTSTGLSVTHRLLEWVSNSNVCCFIDALNDLSLEKDIPLLMLPESLDVTQDSKTYVQFLCLLLDGSFITALTKQNLDVIIDNLVKANCILRKYIPTCKCIEDPHHCSMKIFKSLCKRKPVWPFIFIDAALVCQPNLSGLISDGASSINRYKRRCVNSLELHKDVYIPKSASIASSLQTYSVTSTSSEDQDNESFTDCDLEEDLRYKLNPGDIGDYKNEQIWSFIYTSGALGYDEISEVPNKESVVARENFEQYNFSDDEDEVNSEPDNDNEETPELVLRNYQHELAENALEGKNTIICAPTGSGKTKVALHIILSHLQENILKKNQPCKVAFIAKTVPLVMQQFRCIEKFLPTKFKVTHLTGDSEDSTNLHILMKDFDVIVMTPKILENHLIKKCLPHLGVFSMLIFDECHHTRKGETYNSLMFEYIKTKYSNNSLSLPQIIGLTASISIGGATEEEVAVKNILKILGNMDVECISMVVKHEAELKEIVPVPTEMMFHLQQRQTEDCFVKIISLISSLELLINEHDANLKSTWLGNHVNKMPCQKNGQLYGQWAVKLMNISKTLHKVNETEQNLVSNQSARSLYIIAYNFALEMYDLVQVKDMMDYLNKRLDKYSKNKKQTKVEKLCWDYFQDLQEYMNKNKDLDNPNLAKLRETIVSVLTSNNDSKSCGIIFVRTRALSYALTSWLKRSADPQIRKLKPSIFTGTSSTTDKGGMSQTAQEKVIQEFRSGVVRLLVSTSVGEEGLDIPECNLVIKYNHIGNEVTTVQTRGRSRKKGGISILLAMPDLINKETINKEKAEMMHRALKTISEMKHHEICDSNQKNQEAALDEEAKRLEREKNKEKKLIKQPFKMICQMCGSLVIDSSDIRTIKQSHRVVVDWKIFEQVKVYPSRQTKSFNGVKKVGSVHCRRNPETGSLCHNKIGSMMIYSEIPFIALGIENFVFNCDTEKVGNQFFKRWKNVPYVIEEITEADFKRYSTGHTNQAQIFNNITGNVEAVNL
ncbi:antiviral innate immune response receptor RIG-I-like isoform X2 [Physella acuta]|uniref:antiviral innate immune response receptor RIG-I-like isoform X2 n=1 Tax=Physella acuta TaxID=109671 RepID=UPI0027DBD85E|nr:antiviral innate immune response receptor RIG-I-like isoform X2 [Physella acuta]